MPSRRAVAAVTFGVLSSALALFVGCSGEPEAGEDTKGSADGSAPSAEAAVGADGASSPVDAALGADSAAPPVDASAGDADASAGDADASAGDADASVTEDASSTTDAATAGDAATSGAALAWFSDWRTATGNTQSALYDGSKWNGQLCNSDVAAVVPATGLGFPTTNVYRSEYALPGQCLMVEVRNGWSPPVPGQYFFFRGYYRNAIPDGQTIGFPHPLHIGAPATSGAPYTTWFNFSRPAAGVSGMTLQLGGGPTYPDQFWAYPFRTNETYRFEVRIHRVTASTANIETRIYDASGTLVGDNDDWHNGETGPNSRTLAQSAPTFPANDGSFTLLQVGNNDPAGLVSGSGRYVYWGALAVAVSANPEGWIGAYPTAAEAAP